MDRMFPTCQFSRSPNLPSGGDCYATAFSYLLMNDTLLIKRINNLREIGGVDKIIPPQQRDDANLYLRRMFALCAPFEYFEIHSNLNEGSLMIDFSKLF